MAPESPRIAVLAGGSGLVGGYCLADLLRGNRYSRVVALGRREVGVPHPKLERRIVDFAALPPFELLEGADVYCALGTTIKKAGSQKAFREIDFGYSLALARRAREAGAARFLLVSSVGATSRSGAFYLRVKGELEEAVEALGFEAVHIFRPSLILGERPERRVAERLAMALAWPLQFAWIGSLRRYRPIHASQVAAAMIAAAGSGATGEWIHEYDDIVRLAQAAVE